MLFGRVLIFFIFFFVLNSAFVFARIDGVPVAVVVSELANVARSCYQRFSSRFSSFALFFSSLRWRNVQISPCVGRPFIPNTYLSAVPGPALPLTSLI